jgi:hypothetical protein
LKKIVRDVTLILFFIMASLNTFAVDEVNDEISIGNENLILMEMKISTLGEGIDDISNRQQELSKAINKSRTLQNEINATASNLVKLLEKQYSNNKPIPIEISQPINWYPYLIPVITIIIVIATTFSTNRTIKVKSKEALDALKDSNQTLVSINNKSIREENNRSQKTIITNNRQEWINSLRDELTLFLAEIASTSPSQSSKDLPAEDMKNLWIHSYKIELLINPKEDDHKELVSLIRQEITNLHTSAETTSISKIISKSQEILKREWEIVKGFEKKTN